MYPRPPPGNWPRRPPYPYWSCANSSKRSDLWRLSREEVRSCSNSTWPWKWITNAWSRSSRSTWSKNWKLADRSSGIKRRWLPLTSTKRPRVRGRSLSREKYLMLWGRRSSWSRKSSLVRSRTTAPCLSLTVANRLTTFTPAEKVAFWPRSRRRAGKSGSADSRLRLDTPLLRPIVVFEMLRGPDKLQIGQAKCARGSSAIHCPGLPHGSPLDHCGDRRHHRRSVAGQFALCRRGGHFPSLRTAGTPDLRKEIGVAIAVEDQFALVRPRCGLDPLDTDQDSSRLAIETLDLQQVSTGLRDHLVLSGRKQRPPDAELERDVRSQHGGTLRKRASGGERRQATEHRESSVFHDGPPQSGLWRRG